MTAQRQREMVIEYEKVQTIRKRARTTLSTCEHCCDETDSISLAEAAELFETGREELLHFIRENNCHYHVNVDARMYLCVRSLLDKMQQLIKVRRLPAKGEKQ